MAKNNILRGNNAAAVDLLFSSLSYILSNYSHTGLFLSPAEASSSVAVHILRSPPLNWEIAVTESRYVKHRKTIRFECKEALVFLSLLAFGALINRWRPGGRRIGLTSNSLRHCRIKLCNEQLRGSYAVIWVSRQSSDPLIKTIFHRSLTLDDNRLLRKESSNRFPTEGRAPSPSKDDGILKSVC